MHTVVVANRKGGTGKTTTAANLAAVYHASGLRVLAIDLDSQQNLTWQLGASMDSLLTTYELLEPGVDAPLEQVLCATAVGVDLLPAGEELSKLEIALALAVAGQQRLAQVLAPFSDRWDVAVVDTPPGLGVVTIASLVAADVVVSPVSAEDVGAAQGLARLLQSIDLTGPLRNGRSIPQVVPVLTRWDERRKVANSLDATLEAMAQTPVARIPSLAAIHQSTLNRMPFAVLSPDSVAAAQYRAVADVAITPGARHV